jgi:ATP-dependent Clp protease, protease subunit
MGRITKEEIDRFHDYGIYLPCRTIYLGSEEEDDEKGESGTDSQMAMKFVKNIKILEHLSQDPIRIILNNPGGDEYHGLAIYDAIKGSRCHTTVEVYGHAMSMGSIILQAASERVMAPNSRMMIHYGTWGVVDHPKITYKWAEEGKKFDKWMEKLYLEKIREKHPGFTMNKLEKMLDHDTFLTSQEAVDMGLADKVLGD